MVAGLLSEFRSICLKSGVTLDYSLLVREWSFFIRSCPPSYDILQIISEIGPVSFSDSWWRSGDIEDHVNHDHHNILQWLKVRLYSSRSLLVYIEAFECFRHSLGLLLN
jgi:hypothetical protein